MQHDFLDLLTERAPEREQRVTLCTWVRQRDKQRALACANALGISLCAFADRALQAAIAAVETTLIPRAGEAESGE